MGFNWRRFFFLSFFSFLIANGFVFPLAVYYPDDL